MATAILSATSPTGYVDSNGNPVTSTGAAYTGAGALSGSFSDLSGTSSSSGLTALTPTTTTAKTISLQDTPSITETAGQVMATPYNTQPIVQSVQEQAPAIKLADGGVVDPNAAVQTASPAPTYNYQQSGFPQGRPYLLHGHTTQLYGTPHQTTTMGDMGGHLIGMHAEGGSIPGGHNPEFFSEGGLKHAYVKGAGDGTSDSVPAMLASGEFVIPADVVSSLGNGDNDAGAKTLDEFLRTIREHKRNADAKHLPPDSKGPLTYLKEAKQKVK